MAAQLTLLTRVTYQGQPIASPRVRQLLAVLSSDLHTGASSARLIDDLWPDKQPSHPTKALQVLVSRTRSQLGNDLIVSTATGYRLGLSGELIDTHLATSEAAACERAARAQDDAAALAHAESGLALWDAASDDLGDGEDPLSSLRRDHATVYAALSRGRALALSRLGRHAEALAPLTELVERHPLDEQLLTALLRSEAATTGAAAALARYEDHRRRLRDTLGTDPGRMLQQVQRELLDGGPRKVRTGVPFEPNSLIGRDADLVAVGELIRSSRVTSIVGPGGLGKTRLAHLVSHRADQPRVHFVALAGVSSPDAVAAEVASALGVRDQRIRRNVQVGVPRELLPGIAEALSPGPTLLVLDNCEHVIGGVADLVQSLVLHSPDLRVLTTSRAPLGVTSESVYLLPELDLTMSIDLFTQRARSARPGVDLPPEVVRQLCEHLDGLPLALELAAARTRVMSVAQIAARLSDRFTLLRGGARDAPERHRTLQAVIDWSWNLLKPSEQRTLAALSVFPDGFTLEGAEALLRDETGPVGVVDSLDALIEQSLLRIEDRPAGTRYRMLETVREFGATQLVQSGESEAMHAAFQAWATEFGTASAEPIFGPDPLPVLDRLRDEQDNLVAALRTSIGHDDPLGAACTFGALGALWTIESNHSRTLAYSADVSRLLSHYQPDDAHLEVVRSALVMCATDLFMGQHSGLRAVVALRRLPAGAPDTPMRAFAVMIPRFQELLRPGAPIPEDLRDSPYPALRMAMTILIGQVWENDGQLDKALVETEKLLAGPAAQGPWERSLLLGRVGELYLQCGRLDEGVALMRAALPLLEQIGATADEQAMRWAIALAALTEGDVAAAEVELESAGRTVIENPFGPNVNDDLRVRAELDIARGDIDSGLRRWRNLRERLDDTVGKLMQTDPPGLEPWSISTEAMVLAAHARHDHLADVDGLERILRGKLQHVVSQSHQRAAIPFSVDVPVFGMGLLAIGLAQLRGCTDSNGRRVGAALVALSGTMGYPRYQPTLSPEWSAEFARETAGSAYDSAVERYADLPLDERVPEGLRLLDALDQS